MISCAVYFITFGYSFSPLLLTTSFLGVGQSTRFFYSLSLNFPTYVTVNA